MPKVTLGTVDTFAGGALEVTVDDEGDVTLDRLDGRSSTTVLRPDAQAKLRELLDRAAMPGQPATAATEAGPTAEQVRRCGDSEDPFHRCPVCYDYAAERDRTLAELKDERSFAASAVQAARDAREAWNDPDDHPF